MANGLSDNTEYILTGRVLQQMADNIVTKITGPHDTNGGGKHLTIYTGHDGPPGNSYDVGVGSDIAFSGAEQKDNIQDTQATGTFRVTIDGQIYDVPINGLAGTGTGTVNIGGHLLPSKNAVDTNGGEWNVGSTSKKWHTVYAKNIGASGNGNAIENGYFTNLTINGISLSGGTTQQFWRGDGTWTNILQSTAANGGAVLGLSQHQYTKAAASSTITGYDTTQSEWRLGSIYFGGADNANTMKSSMGRISSAFPASQGVVNTDITRLSLSSIINEANNSDATTMYIIYDKTGGTSGGFADYARRIDTTGNTAFKATKVFNAVFNDYAEYRTTIDLEPGRIVVDNDDGSLSCASERLQPGAQVISDTFGHSMGETPTAKTPIAVAGRALVYPYRKREEYHAGMAVCSAPDGTVDIMTREEIRDYPDCIVGIVSEIPEYEEWGSDNVKVNGRIWIRVK